MKLPTIDNTPWNSEMSVIRRKASSIFHVFLVFCPFSICKTYYCRNLQGVRTHCFLEHNVGLKNRYIALSCSFIFLPHVCITKQLIHNKTKYLFSKWCSVLKKIFLFFPSCNVLNTLFDILQLSVMVFLI